MSLPDSFEQLIDLWSRFPGVGEKTARRMVFFMLEQEPEWTRSLARALMNLHDQVRTCRECGALSEEELCRVCADGRRNRTRICVVETQEDCVAMERAGVYDGLYHVLGGRCSPLEDREVPEESLRRLRARIEAFSVREVILALNPRIEGDLTAFAVQEALAGLPVVLSRLSYGLPVGGSIGYADRMTLHVAFESRRRMESAD